MDMNSLNWTLDSQYHTSEAESITGHYRNRHDNNLCGSFIDSIIEVTFAKRETLKHQFLVLHPKLVGLYIGHKKIESITENWCFSY